ncbi:ABC transporter substrate-binding protein [Bradyrhizobium sp. USDA 4451]
MLSTGLPARLLVLTALALGFAAAAGAQEKKTLKLQDTTSYTQQPIVFGVEKGFFAEEGLNVEFVGTQDPVTATSRGDVTFAFGPTSVYLRAAALGAPIKIVAAAFRSKGPYFLIARKGIKSFADLKGKTIGVGPDTSGNLASVARYLLRAEGIDPDRDVTLFAAGATEKAYGALETGQVDATIIHQPFAALGEIEGVSTTLARAWDYLPTYHTGVLIAGDAVIAGDPDLLRRGLRAYFKSYTYAKAHYDEYLPWLQARLKINPEAVKRALYQEDDVWDANPAIDPKAIHDTQQLEIDVGNQKEFYDAAKYIDERFIPQEYVKPFVYPGRKTQ